MSETNEISNNTLSILEKYKILKGVFSTNVYRAI